MDQKEVANQIYELSNFVKNGNFPRFYNTKGTEKSSGHHLKYRLIRLQ